MTVEQAYCLKTHSTIWVDGYVTKILHLFQARERAEVIAINETGIYVQFVDFDWETSKVPFAQAHHEPLAAQSPRPLGDQASNKPNESDRIQQLLKHDRIYRPTTTTPPPAPKPGSTPPKD